MRQAARATAKLVKAKEKEKKQQDRLVFNQEKQAVAQFCIDWLKQDPTEFLAKQRAKWRSARDWVEPVENSTAVEQVDFSANNSEEISDLCCTCQQPYNEEELYYHNGCDSCGGWFHPECMGMDGVAISRANRARKWHCNGCKLEQQNKRQRNKK